MHRNDDDEDNKKERIGRLENKNNNYRGRKSNAQKCDRRKW